jgi:hypothetical protein
VEDYSVRKLLCTSAIALVLAATTPARAQIFGPGTVVFDPTEVGKMLEQIGISGQELDQLVQTYAQVVNVYNMSTNIWNSVSEVVGAGTWAAQLVDPSIRNPMPFAANAHPGYVGGFTNPSGLPFGSVYMGQNTVGGDPSIYSDGSFAGGEITKTINSLSAMQSLATNNLQAIETRIAGLSDLFDHLSSVGTIQETSSLSSRLNNELNYANSQQVQAQQTMSAAQLQMSVLQNNQTQWTYQDETNSIGAACGSVAQAGGFVTFAACTGGMPAGAGPGLPTTEVTGTSTVFVPGTSTPIAAGG